MANTMVYYFSLFFLVNSLEIDPYEKGPYEVDFTTIKPDFFGIQLDHHLDVFSPHAAGNFPVVVFFPGLSCTTPASYYSTILTHIASHGYNILGPWALLLSPTENYKAEWVDKVLQWADSHLNDENNRVDLGLFGDQKLDFSRLILGSQSSGAHVAVNWLKTSDVHCDEDIQSMFLLSPVDGVDPYGLIHDYCIEPGTNLNIQTPTLIVSGGLDSVPGIDHMGGIVPACAPTELSNERFFNAMTGPTLLLNTTDYGHIDCMDQDFIDLVGAIHFCKTDAETDKDVYRTFVAGQIVAFLQFIDEGNTEMDDILLQTSFNPGIDVSRVDTKGDFLESCGLPGCIWQEGPF